MGKKEAVKVAAGFVVTVLLLVVAITLLQISFGIKKEEQGLPTQASAAPVVVIDAGHGGMDGGAVAPDGTAEKEINLEISEILACIMEVSGVKAVMTRTEDVMPDGEGLTGSAKLRDLKQRLVIASQYPDALLVSIHCNKFPLESCKGLQVYYSGHTKAEKVAETVQESFLKIDPANHRQIKKADTSIYLLNRAKIPSILVECGFLSNKEELARLKTEEYRKMLALVVAGGILGVI